MIIGSFKIIICNEADRRPHFYYPFAEADGKGVANFIIPKYFRTYVKRFDKNLHTLGFKDNMTLKKTLSHIATAFALRDICPVTGLF